MENSQEEEQLNRNGNDKDVNEILMQVQKMLGRHVNASASERERERERETERTKKDKKKHRKLQFANGEWHASAPDTN